MRKVIRVGVAGLTGLVFLAGCSGLPLGTTAPSNASPAASSSPSAQPQSQTEACLALLASLGGDLGDLPSVLSDLQSDPVKALKVLKKFSDNLGKASATLTNPKVKAQADRLAKALATLITDVQKVVNKPQNASKLGKAVDKVRTEASALGTLCTGL